MSTLLISDLHLHDARPDMTAAFLRFLDTHARTAEALYILGDLFEAWLGDDDPSQTGAQVAHGIRRLTEAGVPVAFMHGNRDFLLGQAYAQRCGMRLLDDPLVINLHGTPTLLSHGDGFCTDDEQYQQLRAQIRQAQWQQQFLAQPLSVRQAFAEQARAASQARFGELSESGMAEAITDVNADAIAQAFATHQVTRMIHGHTHRPAIHQHNAGQRIVLGDWYSQGSVLEVDENGVQLSAFAL